MFTLGDDGRIGNNLLDSLKIQDRLDVAARLVLWRARPGQIIYEPGADVTCAFFPLGAAIASFRIGFADGDEVETALIGREGALGGVVSRGALPAFSRSVAQTGGEFARIRLRALEEIKSDNPRVREMFNRYADCLMAQIFQATACNAAHSVEQRAAKWLIAAAERSGALDFTLTQQQLAGFLGVGRTYLSRVLRRFRDAGLVETRRARVVIRDLDAMKAQSCGCDDTVRRHFDTVLKGVYPQDPERLALERIV